MIHILLGIDPLELGAAPFALANRDSMDLKARDLGLRLHPAANVHIMPAEAGQVGVTTSACCWPSRRICTTKSRCGRRGHQCQDRAWQPRMDVQRLQPNRPAFEGAQITFGMRAAPGAMSACASTRSPWPRLQDHRRGAVV